MQDKDEQRGEYYIGVGGNVDDGVREEVAAKLRERTGKTVETDLEAMQYSGQAEDNSVNYLTDGGGLQLELTPGTCYRKRKPVACAVVETFADRIA
jgi:phage replication-related protein YjqB (UPF0714/DUF867 family)